MSKFIWCLVGASLMCVAQVGFAQQPEAAPAGYGRYYEVHGDYHPVGPCARCGWHAGSSWDGYCHDCSRCWTLADSLHALKEGLFGWLHHGCHVSTCCPQDPCHRCRRGFLPRLWHPVARPGTCCGHSPVGPPVEVYEEGPESTPTPMPEPEKTSRAVPRSPRAIGAAVFRRPVPRRAYRSPSYRSSRPRPTRAY